MNILVLGATGRVGLSVIDYALAGGHRVVAVVRNLAKIQRTDANLILLEGDIYQPQLLVEKLQEQVIDVLLQEQAIDVLINVVGGDVFKPSTVVTDSVKAGLEVMKRAGIGRYLGITGIAEMQTAGLAGRITIAALRLSPIRYAVRDHDSAFALVEASDVNWTLAGCPYIRDGQHTGTYKEVVSYFPGGFKTISPQDVADFLVKEMEMQRFPRKIVGIWK